MDTNIILNAARYLNEQILVNFNKEGILIFVVFSFMFFILAAVVAKCAWESGQFKDIESSKYDMLQDDAIHEEWLEAEGLKTKRMTAQV